MKTLGYICGLVFLLILSCPTLADVVTNSQGAVSQTDPERLARQAIITKLDRTHIPYVSFVKLSLQEVVRQLNDMAKQNLSGEAGIAFSVTTNSVVGSVEEINSVVVNLPSLTDVRLADLLDAIVLVASQPIKYHIQSDGVVFSAKAAATSLISRAFKADHGILYSNLINSPVMEIRPKSGTMASDMGVGSTPSRLIRNYFTRLGVDFDSPRGKSIFYNDRTDILFVKATAEDLDKIERVISAPNQVAAQVRIRARFVGASREVIGDVFEQVSQKPHAVISLTNQIDKFFNQALPDSDARAILSALRSRDDVKFIAEPEATTSNARRVQMRAITRPFDVVNDVIVAKPVELGPALNVTPYVLSDGCTINLELMPLFMELLGQKNDTSNSVPHSETHDKVESLTFTPDFQFRRFMADANLWDGQTVMLGGLIGKDYILDGENAAKSKRNNAEMLIFVTAEIVDSLGKRVHSDADLSFAQKGVPAQPKPAR